MGSYAILVGPDLSNHVSWNSTASTVCSKFERGESKFAVLWV